jgi:hypothetical protein
VLALWTCTRSFSEAEISQVGEDHASTHEIRQEPIHALKIPHDLELEVESIGISTARAWWRLSPIGRADNNSPWMQLIWYKKDDRTTKKSYFASVNVTTFKLNPLTMIPSMEPWSYLWVEGKLYIGMNLSPRLIVYDPASDELKDLGQAFEKSLTLYRIAIGPDGVLALGGGTGTDIATYDPKTNTFDRFGQVGGEGAQQGYIYSLSIDDEYVYCAVRGKGPWELISLHRKSKARKVLATVPANAFMEVFGNTAIVPAESGKVPTKFQLLEGRADAVEANVVIKALSLPSKGFSGQEPKVSVDEEPLMDGKNAIDIFVEPHQEKLTLEIGLDEGEIGDVISISDGKKIAGLGRAYTPMVITNLVNSDSLRVPMPLSSYSIFSQGSRIFSTGYPSAKLIVYDIEKPITHETDIGGRIGVSPQSPEANPREIHYFSKDTGGAHIGLCMTPASDDKVYLVARRHRYYFGFALAWFDPKTLTTGVIDDKGAFNHLQIGWMTAINDGQQLAISTYIQNNPQLTGAAPASAFIFIYDVKSKEIVNKLQPFAGSKLISGIVQTDAEHLIGVSVDEKAGLSTVFRMKLKDGSISAKRTYNVILCSRTGDLGVPVVSPDFRLGPDGKVWTAVEAGISRSLIVKLDAKDLSMEPVGTVAGSHIRMLFHEGELFISGAAKVRRVLNWKK